MATVKFNLRGVDSTKPQPIYLIFRHKTEKLVFPTGVKIIPKYWNKKTCRVRSVTEVNDKDSINNLLNDLQKEALKKATDLITSNQPVTKEIIKEHLEFYTGSKTPVSKSLFGFIENFIDKAPTRINPYSGKPVSYKMQREYERTFFFLKDFCKQKGKEYDFCDIDLDFYEDFTEYLKRLDLATNTIGKKIQTLKIFLNSATEKGANTNFSYKSKRFKTINEESEAIYLTDNELLTIYNFDFSKNERLEKVRDLFLVGAYTGCRFSDVTQITPDNIKGDMIEMEQQKTGCRVVIPFHWIVKEIWKKYEGDLPQSISNQKFNDYIKEVCQLVGLKTHETKSITKGGIKRTQRFEKWELVSSHTARRSFATNLYKSGFPAISIMKITGHKTESAFLKYIKVTPGEHAEMLAMHWTKQGTHLRIAN